MAYIEQIKDICINCILQENLFIQIAYILKLVCNQENVVHNKKMSFITENIYKENIMI